MNQAEHDLLAIDAQDGSRLHRARNQLVQTLEGDNDEH
jgi:hypothetical protein